MHAYIHPERFPIWFNIFSLPLNIDDPDKYYCTYTQELSSEANTEQMTNLSAKATSQVLQTCIISVEKNQTGLTGKYESKWEILHMLLLLTKQTPP
jgi:hypothetical protein